MGTIENPRAAFAAEVGRPDDEIDLTRAALLIAAEEYPDLDLDAYLARFDELAEAVRARLSGDEGPAAVLAAINGHLYRELGFQGNRDRYYEPENSYLNRVLDRRTGIPITLALVYREVAARLGHRLVGVNFPLHFVLAWPRPDGPLIVDAFEQGQILTPADCAARLSATYGQPVTLGREHFEPVGPRPILRRVLNNLRVIHVQAEDYRRALAVVERMRLVLPTPDDQRDQGLLLFRLGRHREAEAELAGYLADHPEAPDHAAIEQHLAWVRRLRAAVN